jgi:hypothetical protein
VQLRLVATLQQPNLDPLRMLVLSAKERLLQKVVGKSMNWCVDSFHVAVLSLLICGCARLQSTGFANAIRSALIFETVLILLYTNGIRETCRLRLRTCGCSAMLLQVRVCARVRLCVKLSQHMCECVCACVFPLTQL